MRTPHTPAEKILHYLNLAALHPKEGRAHRYYIGCIWQYIGFGGKEEEKKPARMPWRAPEPVPPEYGGPISMQPE